MVALSCNGPHEPRPGRRRQFDGRFDRRDPSRLACTTLDDEEVDLYAVLHGQAWPCRLQVVYVLPRGADPQTREGVLLYSTDTELAPERYFRLYGARFQIEFAFRDAKQHLGIHHSQARSQAKLHFHFNIVFAASSGPACRPGSKRRVPWAPFPCTNSSKATSNRKYANALPPGRRRAHTPSIPRAAAASRRNASGCAHPLPNRGRLVPECHSPSSLATRFRPQNCPNHSLTHLPVIECH